MDEPDRLHWEGAENGRRHEEPAPERADPDVYMLDDILNPDLPEYKLYLFFSPVTITPEQIAAIKQKPVPRRRRHDYWSGRVAAIESRQTGASEFGLQVEGASARPPGSRRLCRRRKTSALERLPRTARVARRPNTGRRRFLLLTPIWTQIRDPDAVVLAIGSARPSPA